MKTDIVTDPVILTQTSGQTTWDEVNGMDLVATLKEACEGAWTRGCGLAAIQVGAPIRFAWFRYRGEDCYLINPEIIKRGRNTKPRVEGCLSIPERWFKVERSNKIIVRTDGREIICRGKLAQIVQHEIDHMDGKLISDFGREVI